MWEAVAERRHPHCSSWFITITSILLFSLEREISTLRKQSGYFTALGLFKAWMLVLAIGMQSLMIFGGLVHF
jgi:hypothetical protein